MEIRRTYKEKSLKFGKVETVDEAKAVEVFGQTSVAHHSKNECKPREYEGPECNYCHVPAMTRLRAGAAVETFFSKWELIAA